MEDRILTLHPEGKQGVNIERKKYDLVRNMILDVLSMHAPIGFMPMCKLVEAEFEGKFDGSVTWYCVSVKLDMEARGEVLRKKVKGNEMLVLAGEA